MSACLVAACRSLRGTGSRRCYTPPLPRHIIISSPPRHRLSIPHRNAIAATLEKDAVSRTLRSSDRFGGRRVFFSWRRRVVGVAGGRCLRRFGVVLVRERVGGELRGGHGCPGPSRSHVAPPERAAVRVAGRMERSAAVFWGAGACGCFFAEKRSVCSRVLSAVWSGPVRMRGQRFCVFDPTLTLRGVNTGFLNVENIGGKFCNFPFSQRCLHRCDDVARDPKHLSLSSG